MTVASDAAQPPRNEYVENGATLLHDIDFQFYDAAEITVRRILVDGTVILLAQPTHYSVSGGNGSTGSITKVSGGVAGATIQIDRDTVRSQTLTYTPEDQPHEEALDRLEMQVQELRRDTLTEADVVAIIAASLVAGDGISFDVDLAGGTITINNEVGLDAISAVLAEILIAGTGIELTVDAVNNTITIGSTAAVAAQDCLLLETGIGSGSTGAEDVRDIIGAALLGLGCTIVVNDGANTITVDLTDGVTAELIRDTIGAALVAGSGIAVTVSDVGNTITIAVDDERIRDAIGSCLVAGSGISITVDDAGNTITIAATGLDATYKGIVPTTRSGAFSFTDAMIGRATDYTGSAASATIDPEGTTPLSAGWAHSIRNKGSGVLTIHRGAGVSLVQSPSVTSADVAIPVGAIAFLHRWAPDDFTISVSA
jgi:hypothetical protein